MTMPSVSVTAMDEDEASVVEIDRDFRRKRRRIPTIFTRLYSAKQLRAFFRISPRTLQRWIRQGILVPSAYDQRTKWPRFSYQSMVITEIVHWMARSFRMPQLRRLVTKAFNQVLAKRASWGNYRILVAKKARKGEDPVVIVQLTNKLYASREYYMLNLESVILGLAGVFHHPTH